MKKTYNFLLILLLGIATQLSAQSVPAPGPKQTLPIIFQEATIHTGTGEVLENASLLVVDGKIVEVGKVTQAFKNAEVINLKGKHIYPGFIAPATTIGLDEIEAVRATRDFRETGEINPNVRAIIGYNTDSRVTPTIRSNGILLAQISPRGGLFGGTSSVVQLDAWNWEDAAYKMDDGVHLYWPRMRFREGWWAPPIEEQKKRSAENLGKIEEAMLSARSYFELKQEGKVTQVDLRWEALAPVLAKEKPIFIHAHDEKQIMSAVAFANRHEVKMILVGGRDAWRVTELLKENEIAVILDQVHSLPATDDDDIDIIYRQPKMLQVAGILYCLGMRDFWNTRNLPFQAGTAAAYGLTPEEALATITLNTAKILGIDDRTGSIEVGKDANLIVSSGDALDMRTSNIEMAFIQGRKVNLANRQKDLVEKFRRHTAEGISNDE